MYRPNQIKGLQLPARNPLTSDGERQSLTNIFSGEQPKTHGLRKGWILLIIFIIIVVVIIVFWLVSQRSKKEDIAYSSNKYVLVWADDFSEGTPSVLDDRDSSKCDHYSRYPPNTYCKKNQKCSPNVEKWTAVTLEGKDDLHLGNQVYTNHPRNVTVHGGKLFLRALPETTSIMDREGTRTYNYTSAKLISRAAFSFGFFAIRTKINKGSKLTARIGLLPYYNVCMNQVGSKYGRWPACGEIEYLRTTNSNPYWFGSLTFGGKDQIDQTPEDGAIKKIDWTKHHIFGLEWTPHFIAWHLGSDICPDGSIGGGKILQKVTKDEWFTLTKNRKKKLPPSPFDQPFHLILSLSVNSPNGMNSEEIERIGVGSMEVDWVKVYQKPSKAKIHKVKESSDSDSDSDDEDDLSHDIEIHHPN
uniref:Glycosyl hydrolase family 16 n=1 Tax=Pithovirus LCPAC202 TaxID=2506592 RepID=A0A481Z684_9VIRU|nr:MAG: glycosyl hydrolase family 16 [Pithovirus LCPAC202]